MTKDYVIMLGYVFCNKSSDVSADVIIGIQSCNEFFEIVARMQFAHSISFSVSKKNRSQNFATGS